MGAIQAHAGAGGKGPRMQHPLLSALLPTFHLRSANSTRFPSTLPFLTYDFIPIAPDSSTLVALGYLFFLVLALKAPQTSGGKYC